MKAGNKLGLILFPAYDWAISPTHPEREERLLYTQDQITEEGIEDIENISFYNPEIASKKDIDRVHICYPGADELLTKSHFIAAGGAIKAFDLVLAKKTDKSFALIRPPGHHAMQVVYGDRGFCIANNEAVGLEYARRKYGDMRVAIVDTDCHHGDGTQDIYWNDPDTLFISFHQDGRTLYPGTGFVDEQGGPGAYGLNINIPLPPYTGDEGFQFILNNLVLPILEEFKPDLIINSAGQDNHYSDPLTNMNFSAQGYAKLNDRLDPDICILEGGYSIQAALPYVNTGIILAMAGLDYSAVYEPDYDPKRWEQQDAVTKKIEEMAKEVYELWQKRKLLAARKFAGLKTVKRAKRIYYDTAGIMASSEQEYRLCRNCPGLGIIHSRNDQKASLLAITIPRQACPFCEREGKRLFNQAKNMGFKKYYLQDQKNDQYQVADNN